MKKNVMICLFTALFCVASGLYANSYVALHKADGISFFSGSLALRQAHDAASPGDTIYLPGGSFQAPDTIVKKIFLLGVGHYPSHTKGTGITYVTGPMRLNAGASDSYFEGIYFNSTLTFAQNEAVSNVMFRRCRIDGHINYPGDSSNPQCVNNQYIECVHNTDAMMFCHNAVDMVISNCIIRFGGFLGMKSSLVTNSVFPSSGGWFIQDGFNNIYRNNIIRNNLLWSGGGNLIQNNIFPYIPGYGQNVGIDNHTNIDFAELFEKITLNNTFSYDFDFHLKDPSLYAGTDGTQIGIYGGMYPYKDGAVPFNPHVVSKNISNAIDANGNIRVEINVSAQQQ